MLDLKVIVFDWDGTLMDSEAAIVAALSQAYRDEDLPAPPYEGIRALIGLSLGETINSLTPDIDPDSLAGIVSGYRRNYARRRTMPALFSGVHETLITLQASGYHLAIATGKSDRGLRHAIEYSGLDGLFAATRTADLSEPKPSPKMLMEIIAELDVRPDEALMIGDTEYDLAMAKTAGTHRAGVSYGAHPVSRLLPYGPAFVLNQFGELPGKLTVID